jgi:subtilase family serine protease
VNTPGLTPSRPRGGRLAWLLGLSLVATLLAPGSMAVAQDPGPAAPSSFAPTNLGTADPADRVEVNLVLAQRDPAGSKAYLAAIGDPASPDYRHFLTATESGARFGATDETIARITAALNAARLDVVSMPPQRTRLVVGGTAADLGSFLGLSIDTYQDPRTGVVYHASATDAVVPPALQDVVLGVTGLSRYLPVSAIDPADAPPPPARGLKPADLAKAYGYQSLWDQGIDGTGTTVAILQFGVDTDEDLAVFDATFGIDGPKPERIPVNGGMLDAPKDFGTEATLDTQVLRAVAPGAQILVFGFPAATTFGAAMDAIVQDGRAQIVSVSYGKCYAPGYISLDEVTEAQASLRAAALAGVTLFAASGDWGAFSCHAFDKTDSQVSTFFPACTDNAVSVGGTFLQVKDDGSYLRETGWEDYLTTSGTGGGESSVTGSDGLLEPLPDFQQGVDGIDQSGGRQCPDVAAAADSDTGYLLFVTDPETGEGEWKMVGGTSASAPFWAGVMALVQQQAQAAGIDKLGFLAPVLYQVAKSHPEAFHDVTRGGNLVDVAGAGWDKATGLGSPDVALLSKAIIEALGGTTN